MSVHHTRSVLQLVGAALCWSLAGVLIKQVGATWSGFLAPFSLYVDSLTLLWMLFVTGLGSLIAIYATEYMEADVGKGYARFFGAVSIFLFAMGSLVMGGNLILLYLGWEGVGLASYLLIGYFYQRPSAVAAAKKAFIMATAILAGSNGTTAPLRRIIW